MYKISTESEGRTYECDLQFAVYGGHAYNLRLYAASFTGRPSPVQAISAMILSNTAYCIVLTLPDKRRYMSCQNAYVAADRIGDVSHAVIMPKEPHRVLIAPDGDLDKALTAWVCANFAVPPELDYKEIFELEKLTVVRNPDCQQWQNLKAWRIASIKGDYAGIINEQRNLERHSGSPAGRKS